MHRLLDYRRKRRGSSRGEVSNAPLFNAIFAMFIKYLGLSPVSIGAWRLHHLHFMTRSIFDPTGNETEHSGNRFTPPDAAEISQMPVDVTDGKVEEDEKEESIEGSDETAPPGKR